MKSKISYISAILALMLVLPSCESYLDKEPEEDISVEEAFAQRRYAEACLSACYSGIPLYIYFIYMSDPNPFVIASDEMSCPWVANGYTAPLINNGSWNATTAAPQKWINMYEGIRKTNLFLENIPQTPLSTDFKEEDKKRWIGEARFLRAFYHYEVMRIMGPVPVFDRTIKLDDNFTEVVKRKPLDECWQFIIDECDAIINENLLPATTTDPTQYGRPTGASVLALKSQMMLMRASPLFNGNPDYANFTDYDGVHLFPAQYDANKWKEAADAAKECIDYCHTAGYKLYNENPDPMQNYMDLFLKPINSEMLFIRNFGKDAWVEKCGFPTTAGGWNGLNPTQYHVDAYEMEDGTTPITGYNADGSPIINPASGYSETTFATADGPKGRWKAGVNNMYAHREPRFYANIRYAGDYFRDVQLEFWHGGNNGMSKSTTDYNTSGYLMKKYADPNNDLQKGIVNDKAWIVYRLGAIYLNYAEALNECSDNPPDDVYFYLNEIRARAGLPEVPHGLTKEQMREKIRHERQIELAFESHRYFDTHRWKTITNVGPVYGMNIKDPAITGLNDLRYYKRTLIETRVFDAPKHYLFPIPQDEINKAKGLVQSPYW